jgi:hypothetical protein
LEIRLDAAVSTNELDWTCHFYDIVEESGEIREEVATGITNGTTEVTVCGSPIA